MLLYLHKTKCLANVGRGHLVSLFHKRDAGLFIRDVAAVQYVCTAGCDRRSHVTTCADTSLTVPINSSTATGICQECFLEKHSGERRPVVVKFM